MEFINIEADNIKVELFSNFKRYQKVTKCWRKIEGQWVIKDIAFTEEWGIEEYKILSSCLKNTVETGGMVMGAFSDGILKGFVSVEAGLFGENKEYLDLSSIHVSLGMRGNGVGKELFRLAQKWAKENGANKLYISAHSSVESQAFYKAMGCVEAEEYSKKHIEREPYDCQLECKV